MKKTLKFTNLFMLALLLISFSCSNDDSVDYTIMVNDTNLSINENASNGDNIGAIDATSVETLDFTIASQTPVGAIEVNASTGEVTVADATLFDFETNTTISASVVVSNTVESETITLTIDIVNINEIGDYAFGGVIFWLNATGDQGLVCAVTDQSLDSRWYNGSNGNTNATGTEIGTGQANTTSIVNFQGTGAYAAQLCDDLSLNGFNDWFLPSIGELEEIYNNKTIINIGCLANSGTGFEEGGVESYYWSSTQVTNSSAAIIKFNDGFISDGFKSTNFFNVRAVRAFTDL